MRLYEGGVTDGICCVWTSIVDVVSQGSALRIGKQLDTYQIYRDSLVSLSFKSDGLNPTSYYQHPSTTSLPLTTKKASTDAFANIRNNCETEIKSDEVEGLLLFHSIWM